MKAALYARVSTNLDKQHPEAQLRELRQYCHARKIKIFREYVDVMSGTKANRPELNILMKDAMKRRFDAVLVYRFDRFARSTKDLIDALSNFQTLGIDFISLNEGIDTTTPTGKFVFTVMAGLAEFEKTIIVERVRMGLAHARAKGIRLGRPKAEIDKNEVLAMRKNGESIRAIAKKLEISKSYVQRELKSK